MAYTQVIERKKATRYGRLMRHSSTRGFPVSSSEPRPGDRTAVTTR